MWANAVLSDLEHTPINGFAASWIKPYLQSAIIGSQKFYMGEIGDFLDATLPNYVKTVKYLFNEAERKWPYEVISVGFEIKKYNTRSFFVFDSREPDPGDANPHNIACWLWSFRYFKDSKYWGLQPLFLTVTKAGGCAMRPVFSSEFFSRHFDRVGTAYDVVDDVEPILRQDSSVISVLCDLLDCKNVQLENKSAPDKQQKHRKARGKLPLFDYKVLNVKIPGLKRKSTLSSLGAGSPQRVHLCRGHFKEYTADAPLFGRYTGRYWWQPSVRGKGDGMIVKDYKVSLK